ncbi:uncharacterized protein LOC108908252 [Anoplophora glabripennis]|uniref:uncharacterized protein LOC108908252 n=1 Tax=Anoplophora glabripennis TaxID=217634 RepID=UPI0008755AB0|nr:uncharacterized protein LOC108908252 [Anoplophora glabripennis]
MCAPNIFIIKTLLLLWVVCAVLCEHHKRDVHRIVIKQRIPRSHKKGHSNTHGHDHKRGRHHSGRSHGHDYKRPKKHHDSRERDSSEDASYSRENSFEEVFQKQKGHKTYHTDSKKSYSSPLYSVNQDHQETRQKRYKEPKFIFQNEWTPLSSEQILLSSLEAYKERHKKKRDGRKTHLTSLKPPPIDFTTSYPLQFESSSVFPQLIGYPDAFSNFDLSKKTIESNQSPLIGTIEQPNVQFPEFKDNYNKLKNHRSSYEVTELTPSDTNINTLISVPDDSIPQDSIEEVTTKASKHQNEEMKSTQRPVRGRGRMTFRGQTKS